MVALKCKASQETVEFLVAEGANVNAMDEVPEYHSFDS
jgi:hypothetical protein